MFCPDCGQQAEEGAAFCPLCGAKLPVRYTPAKAASPPTSATQPPGQLSPGYSQLAFHPELLAAVERGRKNARKYWCWFTPMPVLFLSMTGLLSIRCHHWGNSRVRQENRANMSKKAQVI